MRHILVVANLTLAGKDLMVTLRERAQQNGALDIYVVVPAATPRDDRPLDNRAWPVVDEYTLAERRLEKGLSLIRAMRVRAVGEVGDSNPMRAIDEAFARHSFDEVVISTLPHDVSHWLRSDLSARVHRKHHVHVTTVTARHAAKRLIDA